MSVFGRVHSIESFSTVDGPGVRAVIFLQGCFLNCIYCHNPDTWNIKAGELIDSDSLLKKVLEYKEYVKGGVTLSGGEPFLQPEFILDLLKKLKLEKIHTAIESSCAIELNEKTEQILEKTDLLILDLKALNEKECRKICNADISKSLNILNYCEKNNKKVWVRHVLLPNFTLKTELLKEISKFLQKFNCIERIELLPFHKMGEFKWKELNLKYNLTNTMPPTKEEVLNAAEIFKNNKIKVVVSF